MLKCVKYPIGALLLAATFFSCSDAPEEITENVHPAYTPPHEELDIAFRSYTINAERGGQFFHPGGSEIIVPANAFMDADGNNVSGAVIIKYREFHDATDIYVSGIPMAFGKDNHLETAGMFEIKAVQNGQELIMKPEHKVNVNMVSYVNDGCYNQFYYDNEKKDWQLIGNDNSTPDTEIEDLENKLAELPKPMKLPLGPNHFLMNFNEADITIGRRVGTFDHRTVTKEAKAYNLSWTKLWSDELVTFYGKKYPASYLVWRKISGKLPDWRGEVKLKKKSGNRYTWYVYNRYTKQKAIVETEAVMTMKYLLGKKAQSWMDEYNEVMAERVRLEKELEIARKRRENNENKKALVFRSFAVADFGLYNSDRFLEEDNAIPVLVDYDFGKELPEGGEVAMFYVSGSNRSVINFYSTNKNIALIPDPNALIFSVMPSGKIMVYPRPDYAKINFSELKKQKNTKPLTLKMRVFANDVRSIEQLKNMMGVKDNQVAVIDN